MLVEGSTTSNFFQGLNDSEWAIRSFNSLTREVCVNLTPVSGTKVISVVLPVLSVSGIKD